MKSNMYLYSVTMNIQHIIILIYPWMYNWRFWHLCWYFSDCDFLHNDLFWAVFYLSPWQCFKTVVFDCTGVIIGLYKTVFLCPLNGCIECIKIMYYCVVRRYTVLADINIFDWRNKEEHLKGFRCCWWSVSLFCIVDHTEDRRTESLHHVRYYI